MGSWICCHLGAREHYAVARALHRQRRLRLLATDAWSPPGGVWASLPGPLSQRLRERYVAELADADIRAFTGSLLAHEILWRVQARSGWNQLMARNSWFQRRAAYAVRDVRVEPGSQPVVFAHSYAALEPFQAAKARGWTTVLGQIDPGEEHCRVVASVAARWPEYGDAPASPPPDYFAAWRQECTLADRIIVNSEWSRDALVRAGVPAARLTVVPLPYERETGAADFARVYPAAFTPDRPLRVLFAGSVAAAKGMPALLGALERMDDVPIELTVAGPMAMTVPARFRARQDTRWLGPVHRSEVMAQCRRADVLVFPSESDGFGMVQVEAQGWQLPVIASPFCGRVVRHGVNGLLLTEVSAEAIEGALRTVAASPSLLASMAAASRPDPGASIAALGSALMQLEPA